MFILCLVDLATVFRDQELSIHEQLDIGRYFGPLHKDATTPVPKELGLEEVPKEDREHSIHQR